MTTIERIVAQDADSSALVVGGADWSYGRLLGLAASVMSRFDDADCGSRELVAILAYQSVTEYAGILSTHLSGRGYVPLNPKNPADRLANMLEQVATRTLLVGAEALEPLANLLAVVSDPLTIIGVDLESFGQLPDGFPQHRFIAAADLPPPGRIPQPAAPRHGLAYVIFTSGSTGVPKGVPVSFSNLDAYVDHITVAYGTGPGDRVAQSADVTFDLCIHPIFCAWATGASLHVIPALSRMAPARFILDHGITVWVSVPSVVMFMDRMGILKPGIFPTIRLSLFCGEPLPVRAAATWQEATHGSRLVNLYGPTEATCSISGYEWNRESSPGESENGVVPLGWIFPTQKGALCDPNGAVVAEAGEGELYLSGSQVTREYLNNPEKTAKHYVTIAALGGDFWYRTGDVVKRGDDGCLFFVGRVDNQIKLHGHRIELQEIDAVLRRVAASDFAVAVPYPRDAEGIKGIVACIAGDETLDKEAVLAACRRNLPSYMVPGRVVVMGSLPLNMNGKIDRGALYERLSTTFKAKRA